MHLSLGYNIIFQKDISLLDLKHLCIYVAFSIIVLPNMLLWSNDFKRFPVSEYCNIMLHTLCETASIATSLGFDSHFPKWLSRSAEVWVSPIHDALMLCKASVWLTRLGRADPLLDI